MGKGIYCSSKTTTTSALTFEEKGIVLVPGRMLLWLKECIKVPEGALNEVVCGHLCEAENEELKFACEVLELRVDTKA